MLAAVAMGGVVGATLRYALSRAMPHHPGAFPTATFLTNVTGSFALGMLLVVAVSRRPPWLRLLPFLATGVLGSYTTFSTFAVENVVLVDDGDVAVAVGYLFSTLVGGLAAAWAGVVGARRMTGASGGRSVDP